ncbi:MAG TPA: DNA alkylation repair protein [Gemmatimonadaceae bacterium]
MRLGRDAGQRQDGQTSDKMTRQTETRETVAALLRALERKGSKRNRDGMARYGIVAKKVFGVSVETTRQLSKPHRKNHELAVALWKTGWLEARFVAGFIEDPAKLTSAQMDSWAKDFDNWAICDHCCFHLFDKSPLAWKKVDQWARRKEEFVRRASFALVASLAGHRKDAPDAPFFRWLKLGERYATDERNFVKKAVSWAMRSTGNRSYALHHAAMASAQRLAASPDSTARWIGRDVLRDLSRPIVAKRLSRRAPLLR